MDLPDPEIEPGSPVLQADSLPTELSGKPLYQLSLCNKSSQIFLISISYFLILCALLLLLLSHFSRVRLCATPWTAAYQALPPMGFSRQEYWSGVPLPSLLFYPQQYKKITCVFMAFFVLFCFLFKSLVH